MSKKVLHVMLALALAAALGTAQKAKTKEEAEAWNAIAKATTADAQIAAVDNLITKFTDSEFKVIALDVAAGAAQQKQDTAKVMFYSEQALKADPMDYNAMLKIAAELAHGTREFDLDKDEKLGRAEKLANQAIALVATAVKPNASGTEEQWAAHKKDLTADGHVALGLAAGVRKKYDVEVAEYKAAVDGASVPDAIVMLRLAGAYDDANKPAEGLAMLNKISGMPEAAQLKAFIDREKARAQKLQSGK